MDVDSSDDEISEEDEDCSSLAYEGGSSGSCCKESEALRKRSFCMKVQTVGLNIAKCVSNWQLNFILYYQERPLLKFDHVSVSYWSNSILLSCSEGKDH